MGRVWKGERTGEYRVSMRVRDDGRSGIVGLGVRRVWLVGDEKEQQ